MNLAIENTLQPLQTLAFVICPCGTWNVTKDSNPKIAF
jgi:hypothetical protein